MCIIGLGAGIMMVGRAIDDYDDDVVIVVLIMMKGRSHFQLATREIDFL